MRKAFQGDALMTKITLSMIEGSERFRVLDKTTGAESFTDDLLEAYRYAGLYISWCHPVRLEERDSSGHVLWASESITLINQGGQAA